MSSNGPVYYHEVEKFVDKVIDDSLDVLDQFKMTI